MGTIHKPSDSGSRGTETTAFIQCINDRETKIEKLWCLGLDRIYREVLLKDPVEIPAVTIGWFVTDNLAENGIRIAIIGGLSVNYSVQFLGLSDQSWGSVLPYISNLLDNVESTEWVSSNHFNHIWGGCFNDSNNIINDTLSASIGASCTNLSRSHGCLRACLFRIRKDFLCISHQERWWRQSNCQNPQVCCQG